MTNVQQDGPKKKIIFKLFVSSSGGQHKNEGLVTFMKKKPTHTMRQYIGTKIIFDLYIRRNKKNLKPLDGSEQWLARATFLSIVR